MVNHLALSIDLPISQDLAWKKIVDWQGQSQWMLQTKVWVEGDQVEGVGTRIAAFTGPFHKIYPRFSRIGILDLMEVTSWQVPSRCDVLHYGKIIKGTGTFAIESTGATTSRFDWSEDIEAPRPLFLLIAPFILLGVKISLTRFLRRLE